MCDWVMLAGGGAPWSVLRYFRNAVKLTLGFSQLYPIAQHHDAAVKCVQNLNFKAVFIYTRLHSG